MPRLYILGIEPHKGRGYITLRGGGLEYLQRIPASRKRRWKGNPVSGDWGSKVRLCVLSGTDQGMTALKFTDPSSHQRGCPMERKESNCQAKKIKIWSGGPERCPTPRWNGQLTAAHKINREREGLSLWERDPLAKAWEAEGSRDIFPDWSLNAWETIPCNLQRKNIGIRVHQQRRNVQHQN
jgi:hypothetical protein